MKEDKKAILITGGAGFIGSNLTEKFLQRGEKVFIIDNLSTGTNKNLEQMEDNKNLHFIEGTVLDEKKMEELIKKSKQIYHLAAAVGVKTIMDKPLESFINNFKGTEIVLRLATKHNVPVLFTSSSEVYGKADHFPFKEDSDRVYGSAYNDRWGYALSKGSDEFLALAYHREKNLLVTIVRLFNVIGPMQSAEYGMVVPRFVKQALSGKPITIYGTGSQTRCFTDVEDITEGIISLMNHPNVAGQIFNLGDEREITMSELAQKIKELTKSTSPITYISYDEAYSSGFEDMARRKPDISKIKSVIGYEPKVSLEQSLKKIIDHFHVK